MAYTDSLQIRYFISTPISNAPGPILDADSGNNAVRCPTGAQLEAFGLLISATGVVFTPPIFEVLVGKSLADGSPVGFGTITLPGPGIVLGTRFECGGVGGRAVNVLPGQYVQVAILSSGVGSGSVEPYIVLRINGYMSGKPTGNHNPNSPLKVVFS